MRRLIPMLCLATLACTQPLELRHDTVDERLAAATALAPGSVYDFYPLPDSAYAICASLTACPWPGDNFDAYVNGTVIECDSANALRDHLEVTSGCLHSKYVGAYRRGWTTSNAFRVLAQAYVSGRKAGWERITGTYRGWVASWLPGAPAWSGFHVFARYQTENDLYVASYRKDGFVTLKKKIGGVYTTLAQKQIGLLQTSRWYTLQLSVSGRTLAMYVNGALQLTTTDSALAWGTTGLRVDYANAYIDDWRAW
jgi:hypothetical protein